MNELEKTKTEYKKLRKKWTAIIKKCESESIHLNEIVEFHKNKFLKESHLFATALDEQRKMQKEWAKLLNPFEIKSERLIKKIERLEKK